ncbi:GNAT family N-acetyltransferase [Shewanella salipaludis]|uniref:GNAT family N-acetyltransferase n=1 Tax=Shewanella salipaludis TaxID=2723052 RepID=A0A972FTJ3_9GAMM|nr:GNAT family N-acetyltransferase [Shewanella salipaludis]NMH65486.1 GNAT family N-acetyltransferase [Shewanella salipaludis]
MPQDSDYQIVAFQPAHARQVSLVFHEAVTAIKHPRYSPEQLNAWSRAPRSEKHWQLRLARSRGWVVVRKGMVVEGPTAVQSASGQDGTGANRLPLCCGFINIETGFGSRGYIDSLYIAPAHQGLGLAGRLYATVELWAREQGYDRLTVDASYVSRPLFEKWGFILERRSYQQKLGQVIAGFSMYKPLGHHAAARP